jgi:MoxR-like ATPase
MAQSQLAQRATAQAAQFREAFDRVREQVGRIIVGQQEVVEHVLIALFAGGHVLLEGVPGLGKTMLVRTLAQALHLNFSRIQFTPDLMPADIIGTTVIYETEDGRHQFDFQEGPVVTNLLLADEINRATPKTQSALLEAMQERRLTVGRRTIKLEEPFVVMATQNPIEQEGTYPLPEAQLDRFLFKLIVGYPTEEDYFSIIERTTTSHAPQVEAVVDAETILRLRDFALDVPVARQVQSYAIRVVMATQPDSQYAHDLSKKYVALGASPRGVQGLILSAKVRALVDGRYAASCADVRASAFAVLRHRILMNYEGEADGVRPEQIIQGILETTRE